MSAASVASSKSMSNASDSPERRCVFASTREDGETGSSFAALAATSTGDAPGTIGKRARAVGVEGTRPNVEGGLAPGERRDAHDRRVRPASWE